QKDGLDGIAWHSSRNSGLDGNRHCGVRLTGSGCRGVDLAGVRERRIPTSFSNDQHDHHNHNEAPLKETTRHLFLLLILSEASKSATCYKMFSAASLATQ